MAFALSLISTILFQTHEEVSLLKSKYDQDIFETKKLLEVANQELNKLGAKYDEAKKEANDAQLLLNKSIDEGILLLS